MAECSEPCPRSDPRSPVDAPQPMEPTISTEFLLRVLRATPEQQAAVRRLLAGEPLPETTLRAPPTGEDVQAPATDGRRFVLRRSGEVWQVVLEGEPDFFGHSTGMTFIDHYLKHPWEPIHPVVLLARLQGQEPAQQRALALDDQETRLGYLREMARLRAVIESEETSPGDRNMAEETLAQLEQGREYICHHTFDNAARAAKTVRQAIVRSVRLLETARDESDRLHPVLQRFAAHLREYLLEPSQRGSAPVGALIYEPPVDVHWV